MERAKNASRGVGVALIATLVITGVAAALGPSIFLPFTDDSGQVQSAPSVVSFLEAQWTSKVPFFQSPGGSREMAAALTFTALLRGTY